VIVSPRVPQAHVHGVLHAGRFDRDPRLARRAAIVALKSNDHYATTEVSRDLRAEALDNIPGTVLAHVEGPGGRDECAMVLKRRKWDSVHFHVVQLNPETKTPTSGWKTVWGLVVTARHRRTRQVHRWLLAHFPAHIQAGRRLRSGPDLEAWKECVRTAAGLVREWLDDPNGPDHVTLLGDFNLDVKVQEHRDYLAVLLPPELRLAWSSPWPRGGTHTDRIIDLWFTTMIVEEASLEPDDPSSDHRPARLRARMWRRPARLLRRILSWMHR
jgi:hypothetical protein